MAVSFDAQSTSSGFAVTSVSWTHTPSGTPTAVGIGFYGFFTGTPVYSCTYGGVSVSQAFSPVTDSANDDVAIYGLASPSAGAQTVVISCSGGTFYPIAFAVTVTGSDTSTCFSAANATSSNSATASVTVSGGSTGELVLCIGGCDGSGATMSSGGGGTNTTDLYLNSSNGGEKASASTAPGAGSVTASYSLSGGTAWAIGAASFKAAASAVNFRKTLSLYGSGAGKRQGQIS